MKKFALLSALCIFLCSCSAGRESALVPENESESVTVFETEDESPPVSAAETSETLIAAAAVDRYDDHIKYDIPDSTPDDEDSDVYRLILMGDRDRMVFVQERMEDSGEIGLFFIDETGERTLLSTKGYYSVYKLWDSIVVCQPLGNIMPCDVYTVRDGKAELIEEISGKGMYLDYSELYNEGLSLIQSVYDGMTPDGIHTFKKYQFYFDEDGFHEYGSVVVPLEEFYSVHGKEIQEFEARIAEDGYEIYEVLYRADDCFILNMRQPIFFFDDEKEQEIFSGAYYQAYAAIKPMPDGTLSDTVTEYDSGRYLTALCPDIAVYLEKVYYGE